MNRKIEKLNTVSDKIEQHINAAVARWGGLSEEILTFRPSGDAWSVKEIIGHLIDSASNNHQRFVRLQLVKQLTFPDYGPNNIHWVRILGGITGSLAAVQYSAGAHYPHGGSILPCQRLES